MGGQVILVNSSEHESPKLMTIPPSVAIIRPMIAILSSLSRKNTGASKATHRGVVDTNTTELATLVYSRDFIHVAKWNARKTPARIARRLSFLPNFFRSERYLLKTNGVSTSVAINNRPADMMMDDAPACCANRMNIAAVEAANIPAEMPKDKTTRPLRGGIDMGQV